MREPQKERMDKPKPNLAQQMSKTKDKLVLGYGISTVKVSGLSEREAECVSGMWGEFVMKNICDEVWVADWVKGNV